MTEVSKLCISCGMCCDGSLFKHAHLFDQDDIVLAQSLNLSVVKNEGFKLPCKYFDGCCTIWTSQKPKICDKFFCKPLKKYFDNEIAFNEAETKVKNLLSIKEKMLLKAREMEEFQELTLVELCEKLDQLGHQNLKKFGILLLMRIELNKRLSEFFD